MSVEAEGNAALARLGAALDETTLDYAMTNIGRQNRKWRVVLTAREEFTGDTADAAVDAALMSECVQRIGGGAE